MPDYSYPSWLQPKSEPWQALAAGAQIGANIAANRARNQALYAHVQQQQQEQDLQERQFLARNEANTLANEVVRLKISNDAEDFQQLRSWWPKFSEATGDTLKTLELPSLRSPDQMQKIVGMVTQKREAEESAGFAAFMGSADLDLATPEGQKRYWEWMGNNKSVAGKVGVNNLGRPIKMAEDLKRLEMDAESRVAARVASGESTRQKLDILGTHYENQDEAARLKLEMQALDKEQNQTYRAERLRQIDEQADRLQESAKLKQAQFEERLTHLSPEKRDLLKRDMDRLDVKAEHGDFKVKTSPGAFGTGVFADTEKYGPKYHEERKKILDSYGVSSDAKADAPLAAPLQKFRFDPATGKLEPIK